MEAQFENECKATWISVLNSLQSKLTRRQDFLASRKRREYSAFEVIDSFVFRVVSAAAGGKKSVEKDGGEVLDGTQT